MRAYLLPPQDPPPSRTSLRRTPHAHEETLRGGPNARNAADGILGADDAPGHDPLRRRRHVDHPENVRASLVHVPDKHDAPAEDPLFVARQREVDVGGGRVAECLRREGVRVAQDDVVDDDGAVVGTDGFCTDRVRAEAIDWVVGRCLGA